MLRYYGGETDKEIAETLGCSPGTVRAHASRALATTGKFWNQMSRFPQPRPDLTINGMMAWYVADLTFGEPLDRPKPAKTAIRMEGNGVAVVIQGLTTKPDLDELRKVAETLRLAGDPHDPDTWFDAAVVIP